jgi:acetyl-CoA carboxylase biotin carboxyl carrier protein
MEVKFVKDLINLMVKNDLVEMSIKDGDVSVNLRRPSPESSSGVQSSAPVVPVSVPPPAVEAAPAQQPQPASQPAPPAAEEKGIQIKSPMVGTVYAAASPDSEPYIKVGDVVDPETVVCIVEAMKVMNEIKAEVSGVIEKILIENGEAVEFGQPLFEVRPG